MQAGQPITFDNTDAAKRKIIDLETIETMSAALTIGGQSLNLNAGGSQAFSIDSSRNATFSGPKLTINGDVDIQGTLNTVSSTEVTFDDSTILLNSNKTGAANTSDPDAGFKVNRGDDPNASFLWNETNDNWLLTGGPLNMGSLRIISLATPTAATDAATMGYVDDANSTMTTFVTGSITTANTAMKAYVDDANTAMTNFVTNSITTANTATKAYVDDANSTMTTFVTGSIATANTAMTNYVDGKFAITSATNTFTTDQTITGDLTIDGGGNGIVVTSGSVGIGVTSPSVALDISGDVQVQGYIESTSEIRAADMFIGGNQVQHEGILPITANTVDGDTVFTFNAL